jgi:hypothetical protein
VDQVLVDLVPFGINKGMGMYPFGIRSWASRCFWAHVSESGGPVSCRFHPGEVQ